MATATRKKPRSDAISRMLASCVTLDDYLRASFGVIPRDEVVGRWMDAPNKGQFRMVIGHRMRSEVERHRRKLLSASSAPDG